MFITHRQLWLPLENIFCHPSYPLHTRFLRSLRQPRRAIKSNDECLSPLTESWRKWKTWQRRVTPQLIHLQFTFFSSLPKEYNWLSWGFCNVCGLMLGMRNHDLHFYTNCMKHERAGACRLSYYSQIATNPFKENRGKRDEDCVTMVMMMSWNNFFSFNPLQNFYKEILLHFSIPHSAQHERVKSGKSFSL